MDLRLVASSLVLFAVPLACTQPGESTAPTEVAGAALGSAAVDLPASTNPYQVTCRSTNARTDVRVYVTQTDVDHFRALVRMTKPSTIARVYDVVPSWSGSGWNFNVPGGGTSLAPFHMLAFPNGEGNIQVFDGDHAIADVDAVTCTLDL